MLEDLTVMDDEALLYIMRSSPRASERRAAACELLVSRHQGLVWSCVRRYRSGPEPTEDLMQVGYVGLLKAIGNFDPVFCRSLAAYARPCISGELKRHFRDRRWQAHVNRPVQELALQIREATWRLAQELGRTPTDFDLTRHLGVSEDDLRHAQQAEVTIHPYSLDAPLPGQQGTSILADSLGAEDPRQEHMLSMQAVAAHWGELPLREQEILLMRFRSGMTQTQIGQRLGISQMQVSRLIARALGYLRSHLLDLEGAHPNAGPAAAPQPPAVMNMRPMLRGRGSGPRLTYRGGPPGKFAEPAHQRGAFSGLWRPTPVTAHDHAELSDPGGSCRSHQQGSCDDGYRQGYRREDPGQGARSGTPARHLDSSLTRLATCSPGQDRLGPGAGLSPSSAGIGGPCPRGNTTASASTIK